MSSNLQPFELFGGAVQLFLPPHLRDFSLDRPLPDNQEVFVDLSPTGRGTVFICEIVETPESPSDFSNFHYLDLADANGISNPIIASTERLEQNFISVDFPYEAEYLKGTGSIESYVYEEDREEVRDLWTYLLTIRIPSKSTDILIYITDGTINHSYESIFRTIIKSIKIDCSKLGL
ncbi:hypothetical protein RCL1_002290 [Eukaryota sp. TZLM3-RCL]